MRVRMAALVCAVASLALPVLPVLPATPAQAHAPAHAEDVTEGLVLRYKLDESSGTVAADASGNGRNGSVNGTAAWAGTQGLGFNGSDTYVKMPDNVLSGLTDITVSADVLIDPSQATPYFIYGMGNTSPSTGHGDGYLFTTGNAYRTSLATGNWSTEQTTSGGGNLIRGVWKHLDYTLASGTAVLYLDGVEVARKTGVTITPGSIGGGVTTANYLGRSLYTGDTFFKGKLRDFRIYNRALAATEVQTMATPVTETVVAQDRQSLSLGDTGAVTTDLTLPATGDAGSAITWKTSDASVITAAGKVTRPPAGGPDARATLTATLTSGASTATKTFEITVKADLTAQGKADAAAEALVVHNIDDVRGNLTLPTTGAHSATVTWDSEKPGIVDTTGVVRRPASGAGGTTVKLTATVTVGTATATRVFTAKVPELPVQAPKTGYLFSYFTGEGTSTGEQVYNALSKGNDPLRYRELNYGKPVLTTDIGTKGARDPFIIRSPEGDKFYQIATDLKIHGWGDWDASQRVGSTSILVWESTDLVHWSEPRLVKVSPDTAGNTWAPEAYYSEELGAYVVYWASKIYSADDPNHTGSTYNKMMYATTRDFRTFSEAKVWNDPGYSVIDSTMIKHDGVYYRFTKDERNNSSSTPCSKFIIEQKSTDILDTSYDFVSDCIGKGAINQGEGPTVFKSNTEDKWYLFIDEFGGRGYIPFETTDLASGKWTASTNYSLPSRPRHGTVLPVTQAEYDRLLAAYNPYEPGTPDDMVLRYEFDEGAGNTAYDVTGNGNNGAYVRTPAWGKGVHGDSFKMAGGPGGSTTAPYVSLPRGVLNGLNNVTVASWVKWTSSSTVNQWLFGLGPDSNKYLFMTPSSGSRALRTAITTGGWQAESGAAASTALPGGEWKHVAVTIDSAAKTATLYLDGVAVAKATNVTVKPSDLYSPTASAGGHIGKSLYEADPYFAGEVDDFRIYSRALAPSELLTLAGNTTGVADVSVPELKAPAVTTGDRVVLPVKPGTDLTRLAPVLTLAKGATVSPASGSAQDLSRPVSYTVTGSDGATRKVTIEARVMNSPLPAGLNADPNIAVFGDTFYLYPTTDGFPGWSGTQYKAYSSKDLVNWTDHGVILDLGPDVSWADDSAWAPGIAEKSGKYYFYFSGGPAGGPKSLGVAVSDSPTGPFTDALGKPLVPAGTYSGQMIDPAVFTDDDGTSYLYWGNGNGYQVPLNADMVSFDAAKLKTYKPSGYNEGSFVFKRDGVYYWMWSQNDTRSEDYQVAYATSTSPLGPWTRQDVILSKDLALGIKGPGHNSAVQVPGSDDWYIVYHRFAIPGGDGTHRETTIDRLEFNADGTIKKVVPTLESVAPVGVAHAGPDLSGAEGAKIALAGRVTGSGTGTWSTGAPCSFADKNAPATTVTCADDGTFTLTLTVGKSSDTVRLTVANALPHITSVSTGGRPVKAGAVTTLRAPFTDAGSADTHTCEVDWRDGTVGDGKVADGVCTAKHTYAKAGIYRPVVTVDDDDGGRPRATAPETIVYDRSAGYPSGSGWYTSPAGAYLKNPALTGKARFSLLVKYRKDGRTAPEGHMKFAFKAGGIDLSSKTFDWLVVTGGRAELQGTAGAYTYRLAVTGRTGTGGINSLTMRIWNTVTGEVVYDLPSGTAMTGGDIRINRAD
ncbi:family 43 glycosylhydrolase [Actinomadura rudentiformis]|uniref:Family 43 glycosylhydrolase n=1 Tax=Actinomadura rudentiformis TaxID=359158 RepID=A0A6H9Y753_9ACTN|nr:family 43 glycosylhydrolase [Actinomadura rudentiformis]KAB2340364.1 family 43 glycosylhydrolase [Actinomadura rudentiformis]